MFDGLEIFLVLAIIIGQLYIAYITFSRIKEYKNLLSLLPHFKIMSVPIRIDDINSIHPSKILSNINYGTKSSTLPQEEKDNLLKQYESIEKVIKTKEGEYAKHQKIVADNTTQIVKLKADLGIGNVFATVLKTKEAELIISENKIQSLSAELKDWKQRFVDIQKQIEAINTTVVESSKMLHDCVDVSLITTTIPGSIGQQSILDSINTYLIRNRSAVADFNLIKDIVERTAMTIEEEVNNTISVPLYMGLLGTLLGIIFGLWNISSFTNQNQTTDILNEAIPVLLSGVRMAMFASFVGLMLTVINSGIFFRKAKTIVERKKNDFYSFIQIELLPVLNQSINSSLASLQTNLHKFNENFTGSLNLLGELMFKNHDAILAQDRVLSSLESIDINEFAKANVKVLRELQKSTDSFHSFNLYMGGVNDALNNTKAVVYRISELIDRADNMNSLAQNINKSFAENNRLISFFNDHRTGLDESKALLKESVGGVSKSLKDAIAELNDTTKTSINELRQMVSREIKLMNEEYPEKWKKLDNLTEIKSDLATFKVNSSNQIEDLKKELRSYSKYLESIDNSLKTISDKTSWYATLWDKIKNIR